jgi:hypothetical protein
MTNYIGQWQNPTGIRQPTQSDALFNAIKHGFAEHQAWLKQALENHFKGLPMPPVQGGKSSQPAQSDADIIANERKAIAAWLRGEVDTDYTDPEYDIGRNLADAVERGAYIQEQSK